MINVYIQTVKGCNLRCLYCYYNDSDVEIMELGVFKKILENLAKEDNKQIKISFHEGEPLLAGIEYYKKIMEIEKEIERKYNVKFINNFQTNGTFINKEWIRFFKKYNCSVGISIDGPAKIHNKTRIFPNGNGSFEAVMQGIRLLRKEYKRVAGICVVNKESIDYIKDIFFFAVRENIDIQINPVSPSEKAVKNNLTIDPHIYAKKIIEIADIWLNGNYKIRLNPIKRFMENMRRGYATDCMGSGYNGVLGVAVNGDVYACLRHAGNKEFLLGNYAEGWFDYERYEEFKSRAFLLRNGECRNCMWVNICNGGCMANAYVAYKNPFKRDCFCKAYKEIFTYIYRRNPNMKTLSHNTFPHSCEVQHL